MKNEHVCVWIWVETSSTAGANIGYWKCSCGAIKQGYQVWGQEPQKYDNKNMAPVYN